MCEEFVKKDEKESKREENNVVPVIVYYWQPMVSEKSSTEDSNAVTLKFKKKLLVMINKKNLEKCISNENIERPSVPTRIKEKCEIERRKMEEPSAKSGKVEEDGDAMKTNVRDSALREINDSQHSGLASRMLEPAGRLASSSGFATALRDLPGFSCSVQPNRSLPLHPPPPVPRRKPSAQPILYAATPRLSASSGSLEKLQAPTERKAAEDGGSEERRHQNDGSPEPGRNGVAEAAGKKQHYQSDPTRPRLCTESSRILASPEAEPRKMVPPIRLIRDRQSSADSEAQSFVAVSTPEGASPRRDARESEASPQPAEASLSKYCIAPEPGHGEEEKEEEEEEEEAAVPGPAGQPMLALGPATSIATSPPLSSAPKTVEIFIPSYPELGIKETRTDRIDLPQEILPPKPIVIYSKNYVLENGQYQPVYSARTLGGRHPEPGGQEAEQSGPKPSQQPAAGPASRSPAPGESGEKQKEWLARRQRMHGHFSGLRSAAFEACQELTSLLRGLPEASPKREQFQGAIERRQRDMADYSSLVNQLNVANTPEKFDKFCEDLSRQSPQERPARLSPPGSLLAEELLKKSAAEPAAASSNADSAPEDPRKGYGTVISCSEAQSYAGPRDEPAPSGADASDSGSLKRTSSQASSKVNGYLNLPRDLEAYGDKYAKPAISMSPRGYIVQQQQQQQQSATATAAKSVIVEPSSRQQSPSSSGQRPQYSSFSIEELNGPAMPRQGAAGPAVLRPTAYPLGSREAAQGARAPPNSPREALIAASVSVAWTEQQQQPAYSSAASEPREYQTLARETAEAQEPRDPRRPLDLAIKPGKRPHDEQPDNADADAAADDDDKRKRKRVAEVSSQWQPALSQANYKNCTTPTLPREAYLPQQRLSPQQREAANHLYQTYAPETSSFWNSSDIPRYARPIIADQYARTAPDYRHQMTLVEQQHKQTVSFEYLYEKVASVEKQAKAREQTISAMRSNQQQQQQQQRRLTPTSAGKPEAPIKPTAQRASPAGGPVDALDPHAKFAAAPARSAPGHPEQQPRSMADQFSSLGNWVAELAKKQGAVEAARKEPPGRATPTNARQPYYQPQPAPAVASAPYKPPADLAQPSGSYGLNGLPVSRWSTLDAHHPQEQQQQQQQQARAFQQARLANPVHQHLQPPRVHPQSTYYPAIPLSYHSAAAKYGMDQLYQKPGHVLGYSPPAPYPYSTAMQAYPGRLPAASLETVGPAQRLSSLVSLTASASANILGPAVQRYYVPAEPAGGGSSSGGARLYPDYRAARRPSLDYAIDQPCTRLLSSYARNTLERAAQQQQQAKETAQAEMGRGVGRPYKNGASFPLPVAQSSRNGSVAGSSSSGSSIYSAGHDDSRRPSPLQQQLSPQQQVQLPAPAAPAQRQQQQPAKPYERECPTPNLGQVSSPNGMQTLRCSFCDKLGSQSICLGCKAAYYCNVECQAQHWQVHMTKCPIVMPRLKKVG